ncbi:MAG: sulfatase [Planctomycetota bacterium]
MREKRWMSRVALISIWLLMTVQSYCQDAQWLRQSTLNPKDPADRPHIVMLFADDWGRYASAYAALQGGTVSDAVQTPNFDKIAADGLLFTHAFVSAPSCTPCRSALMSGQPFWRCDRASILRGAIWEGTEPAYPIALQESGYRIGHTYKVWSPGSPANEPHGGKATSFNKAGSKFNRFSQFVSDAGDDKIEEAKQTLYSEVRKNVRAFMDADNDGELDGDKPICYFFGPTNCHRKWIAGSGKRLWGIDPDSLKGKLPPYLPDVATVRQDFADYLGEAQAFDAGVGVILEELDRLGIADNTIVVVSGDHGIPGVTRGKCNLYDAGTHVPLAIRWPQGIQKPGRVIDDLVSLPDLAVTFLHAASVRPPDDMIARSLVEVFESEDSGRVVVERDAAYTGRERHVDMARPDGLPYPQRAIRTADYLFIINFEPDRWPMGDGPGYGRSGGMPLTDSFSVKLRENTQVAFADMDASPTKSWVVMHRQQDPESFQYAVGKLPKYELFNVKKDPHCMQNLAGSREHQQTFEKLKLRLMNYLHETGDPRVGDNPIFEDAPYTTMTPKGVKERSQYSGESSFREE